MKTKIRWTNSEWNQVLQAAIARPDLNQNRVARWQNAQLALPLKRRRSIAGGNAVALDHRLEAYLKATPTAPTTSATPEKAPAPAPAHENSVPDLLLFRLPSGHYIGLDPRISISEMAMLGFPITLKPHQATK